MNLHIRSTFIVMMDNAMEDFEGSFHGNPVSVIFVFHLFVGSCIFLWSAKSRSGQADSAFLTISKVVSVPVDFICQDAFRIMAGSFKVPFDSCNENITFVIGIKRYLFYPCHSFFVETEIHLCSMSQ